MLGRNDNIRFYLFREGDSGLTEIPPLKDYEAGNKDVISREKDKGKYFSRKKAGKVTLFREGYEYLREVNAIEGVNADVRLIIKEKNDRSSAEELLTISNVGIDLATLDFNDDEQTVDAGVITGGLLELIEKRWDDEIDIMPDVSLDGESIGELNTKTLTLTPRQIFRRSRLEVEDGTELLIPTSGGGLTARAIPFQVDYRSETEVTSVVSPVMNSSGGDYADLQFSGAPIIFNVKQNTDYILRGQITVRVKGVVLGGGPLSLDISIFKDGEDLVYDRKVQLDSTAASVGNTMTYTWNNEPLFLAEGETLCISILTSPGAGILTEIINDSHLFIEQDELFRPTTTRAMRLGDLFDRLIARFTGTPGLFTGPAFQSSGDWYDILIAHGTWLRNMPKIINEGEDDQQEIQAKMSLKNLFEAMHSILEPMRYKQVLDGLTQRFYVGPELETQNNEVRVRIGETRETFELTQVGKVVRKVIGDNYYGKVQLGSNKTGNDYGEVNNLVSICGNATWNTINKRSDSPYEALTDIRTGAEDAELQRSKQYEDNPGVDAEYDEDWFLFDAKPSGSLFALKDWSDYYESLPVNVYSAATNYNWAFTPARILERHAWKIATAWTQPKYFSESLKFAASNCNKSLITKKAGEDALQEGQNIPHSRLSKSTTYPMSVEFEHPVSQEIIEQLLSDERLEGQVAYLTKDGVEYGRLVSVNTNNEGKWQLVQARIA
ncbi:hypothetical protein [Robiginitalea biformata]|uniref:Cyclic nucleotide-binding domain-containing protein n=1 Tax=Robiginitalea biformata (strain ATCC BAA-864 / DSM 15991 / KCTC 12146 / HTCC2501) TaxID=313596 RepID=A4CP54_ROBBH|nr:hypothetical protein [Robiginitalea biformata]EAR14671.1 hypothetical protein RB2501_01306 [Robiginitalea biformata HTCC2501]